MKNKLSKYFLILSISTFIAIFFYVLQNSYNNLMTPINAAKSNVILKPINPNLDISILDTIEKRVFYAPLADTAPTPTPMPVIPSTSSPVAQ